MIDISEIFLIHIHRPQYRRVIRPSLLQYICHNNESIECVTEKESLLFMSVKFVPGSRFLVPGSWFPVPIPGSRFPVPDSRVLVPGSRFLLPCSVFPVYCSRFLVLVSRFLVHGSRFLVPGSWFPGPGSWFPVSASLFRVSCLLFPVPCPRFPVPVPLFLFPDSRVTDSQFPIDICSFNIYLAEFIICRQITYICLYHYLSYIMMKYAKPKIVKTRNSEKGIRNCFLKDLNLV